MIFLLKGALELIEPNRAIAISCSQRARVGGDLGLGPLARWRFGFSWFRGQVSPVWIF
jgi:hypothetical protein